ncbi:hypothetical protein NQ315_013296 [Exocentrus adspersus]|uniref:Farnesol dehydrogenase-like n=1 Tax=Exocentrus adspersus TaxID=1586481 RepID=A0AAV8VHG9_9CUCU|nr:hypothetical protein NQ315_013296 [Exocentrus adspersus]
MVLSMDRWIGKVAVVTGASSGIGAAIAERLVKEGLKVAGLARRDDRLEDLAKKLSSQKGIFLPIKTDISKESDILNAFKKIKEQLGPIHILVNNAGIVPPGSNILEGNIDAWTNIFEVNVIGLCIATREAIKDMKANNVNGHIIHINSILGHQVIQFKNMSLYPATKFAVTALAETLRLELGNQKSKIKITNVSPGLVDTEIIGAAKESPAFKEIIANQAILFPEDIADGVVYALSTPPHVQIQELTIRPVTEPKF